MLKRHRPRFESEFNNSLCFEANMQTCVCECLAVETSFTIKELFVRFGFEKKDSWHFPLKTLVLEHDLMIPYIGRVCVCVCVCVCVWRLFWPCFGSL